MCLKKPGLFLIRPEPIILMLLLFSLPITMSCCSCSGAADCLCFSFTDQSSLATIYRKRLWPISSDSYSFCFSGRQTTDSFITKCHGLPWEPLSASICYAPFILRLTASLCISFTLFNCHNIRYNKHRTLSRRIIGPP